MKKQTIFLFLFILIYGIATAQTVKEICIDKPLKEKDLVFNMVLGNIGKNIYVFSTNLANYGEIIRKDLRLTIYNSEALTLSKTLAVKGFNAKNEDPLLKDALFVDAFLKNEKIYVFWNKKKSKTNECIVQIFDMDLIEIQKPKIIYELVDKSKNGQTHFFYLISPDGTKIIVGGEEAPERNKSLKNAVQGF